MGVFTKLFGPREPEPLRVVRGIVGDRHLVGMDAECVDSVADYEHVVTALAAIADGALVYDQLSFDDDGDTRWLTVERGGEIVASGKLHGHTDYIDEALVTILNEALAAAPGRLVVFDSGYNDQGIWFAYLTREQAERARKHLRVEGALDDLWRPRPRSARSLYGHDSRDAVQLAISADGNLVASAGGNEVRVWDRLANREREKRAVPDARDVAFDGSGELVIGTATGILRGERRLGHRRVTSLAITGNRLVVGALEPERSDQWIEVYDLDTNELVREWRAGEGNLQVAASADAIAAGGEEDTCIVWNLDGTRRFKHVVAGPVWGVAFSPNGREVAFGTESGSVVVFAAADGTQLRHEDAECCWSLAYAADNASIAVSGASHVAIVGPAARELPLPEDSWDWGDVAWLPSGGLVAVRGGGERARIYEWPLLGRV